MKIAIIGSGNLGLSIAKGLVYNNTYTSLPNEKKPKFYRKMEGI